MPVPVPPVSKPVAHPVFKPNSGEWVPKFNDSTSGSWQRAMAALPPSMQTQSVSMMNWKMAPEGMYEDTHHHPEQARNTSGFYKGLTVADNASVIKGAPAEACIPPIYPTLANTQPPSRITSLNNSAQHNYLPFGGPKPPTFGPNPGSQDVSYGYGPLPRGPGPVSMELHPVDQRARVAFLAALNDPRRDAIEEEVGTPFADFVDRAITSSSGSTSQTLLSEPVFPTIAEQPQEPASESTNTGTPIEYRKLAEPLAEWVANYVWKVCTEGLSLPASYAESSTQPAPVYPALPPSYLASSIHSLLLSTLLQPSAVILSVWYIVRLPVYFAAVPLPSDRVKESRFRSALLGDAEVDFDKDTMEASAPFRLVVLGAMLANKWLDDHTFSNKTWHTISHVPIQALNKLEALALDIFGYDLSVPADDWSDWLEHVHSYHLALSSPCYPQPISRPSANPHHLIRRVIEELINSPVTRDAASIPQPVFIGLEQRRQEKMTRERVMEADVMEIDLDEDGPLREEYMLKRRVSNPATYQSTVNSVSASNDGSSWDRYRQGSMKSLPPPAKWSPGADEPILRSRNRVSGQYAPVQPMVPSVPSFSAAFYQPVDYGYVHWQNGMYAPPSKGQAGFYPQAEGAHPSYTYQYPQVGSMHSRSQSASYDQENVQARQHMRSQSQARCEYQCSNIRMTATNNNQHLPSAQQNTSSWGLRSNWGFGSSAFAPIHNIPYPSTWLRI